MQHFFAAEHRFGCDRIVAGGEAIDFPLFVFAGIADEDFQQEAIQLRFGQLIGAFLFDRVLRGEHEKRIGQLMAISTGGDLPFLHGFEQGRLRFGRCAVDLVGQYHVGKQRAFEKFEFAMPAVAVFVHHVGAGDVAGHQVGRELDAVEVQRQALAERADEQRFGQAGHAFKDAVTAREQADQQLLDDDILPDDHAADLGFDFIAGLAQAAEAFEVLGFDAGIWRLSH